MKIFITERLSETVNFLINIKRNYFEITYMHPKQKNLENTTILKINQAELLQEL